MGVKSESWGEQSTTFSKVRGGLMQFNYTFAFSTLLLQLHRVLVNCKQTLSDSTSNILIRVKKLCHPGFYKWLLKKGIDCLDLDIGWNLKELLHLLGSYSHVLSGYVQSLSFSEDRKQSSPTQKTPQRWLYSSPGMTWQKCNITTILEGDPNLSTFNVPSSDEDKCDRRNH